MAVTPHEETVSISEVLELPAATSLRDVLATFSDYAASSIRTRAHIAIGGSDLQFRVLADMQRSALAQIIEGCRCCGAKRAEFGARLNESTWVCEDCLGSLLVAADDRTASRLFVERSRSQRDRFFSLKSVNPSPHNIYVFQQDIDGGLVKIGIAEDVQNRRRGIQSASGVPIVHISSWEVFDSGEARAVEARVHRVLSRVRQHGEWFACLPHQAVAVIDNILCERST